MRHPAKVQPEGQEALLGSIVSEKTNLSLHDKFYV